MPDESTTKNRELGEPETRFEIHASGTIEARITNVGPREAIDIANMIRAHNEPINAQERARYDAPYPVPRYDPGVPVYVPPAEVAADAADAGDILQIADPELAHQVEAQLAREFAQAERQAVAARATYLAVGRA